MTLPTEQRIDDATATVNKFGNAGKRLPADPPSKADRVGADVRELVRRANAGDLQYDGFGSGGYVEIRGSDDPERLTPLEAHMHRMDEQIRTGRATRAHEVDEVLRLAETASAHWLEAAMHMRAAEHAVALASSKAHPAKGPGQEQPECKQIHCHDNSAPGRKGNCEACYRWLLRKNEGRHPGDEVAAVPGDIIEARVEERRTGKRKKVHDPAQLASAVTPPE